jgi:Predicted kinase
MTKHELILMMGVAGSGKSTYVATHYPDAHVYESDAYRVKLFGTLQAQTPEQHEEVFLTMHRDMRQAMKNATAPEVFVYDATNLSRKRRNTVYHEFTKYARVTTVFIYKTLAQILLSNKQRPAEKQVPEWKLREMYMKTQIPKLGADTDAFILDADPDLFGSFTHEQAHLADFKVVRPDLWDELRLNYTTHDSSHHAETVDEHIDMAVNLADTQLMRDVALFHDLGKGLTKKPLPSGYASFYNHQYVSAVYALLYFGIDSLVPEMVYNHMTAHLGFTPRGLRRDKVTDEELARYLAFAELDTKARR